MVQASSLQSPSLSKEGRRAFFILYGAARGMRGSRKNLPKSTVLFPGQVSKMGALL